MVTPSPSHKSSRVRWLWISSAGLLAIVAAVVAVALSAGSSSALPKATAPAAASVKPSSAPKPSPTTAPSPTPTPAPTPTTNPQPPTDPVISAIDAFEGKYGPASGTWKIAQVQRSTVDPDYVMFKIAPTTGSRSTVQNGYGFVHGQDAAWTVIGFGTFDVGCPPGGPTTPVVPTAVLNGFGVSCSS